MTSQELIDLAIEIREAENEYEAAKILNRFEGAMKQEAVKEFADALRQETGIEAKP